MERDVDGYLAKANESLETAKSELDAGRYNSCANRCYYACYQAAVAALTQAGVRPRGRWTHESVQAQFTDQLINRRKRFRASLGQALIENRALRERADYSPADVSQTQASRALNKARTFVAGVEQAIGLRR